MEKPKQLLEITLLGDTHDEQWNNLLELICEAVERGQDRKCKWPVFISTTRAGQIKQLDK